MQSSMMLTMEPEVIKRRVWQLLNQMPVLMAQLEQNKPKPLPGTKLKDQMLMEIAMRAAPGLLAMASGMVEGMPPERLASYINFIRDTLAQVGNPEITDQQFEEILNGRATVNTRPTGPDAA